MAEPYRLSVSMLFYYLNFEQSEYNQPLNTFN